MQKHAAGPQRRRSRERAQLLQRMSSEVARLRHAGLPYDVRFVGVDGKSYGAGQTEAA